MRWRTRLALLCILCVSAVALSESQQNPAQIERERTEWITGVLEAIQTIKVGMTRAELMKIFTTEGGLSTTSQRTYVYRQCRYIKIDVKFAASSSGEELAADRIVEVSRPYLAWSVTD
jgi:hypothetical protein